MATLTAVVHASPDDVFAVLADGWYYSGWVVGTSHMQAVEPNWPAAGSRLFHASGIWPLALRDETRVEEVTPGRRLVLTARARPLGEARIEVTLAPQGPDTLVTLAENPIRGPGRWLDNPLTQALLRRRNSESLARLAAMAEKKAHPGD